MKSHWTGIAILVVSSVAASAQEPAAPPTPSAPAPGSAPPAAAPPGAAGERRFALAELLKASAVRPKLAGVGDRVAAQVEGESALVRISNDPLVYSATKSLMRRAATSASAAINNQTRLEGIKGATERAKARVEQSVAVRAAKREEVKDMQFRMEMLAARRAQRLEALRTNPLVAASHAKTGKALNFLMDRLDAEALYSQKDEKTQGIESRMEACALSPSTLGKLMLTQHASGGAAIPWRADKAPGLGSEPVPFIIRAQAESRPELADALKEYETANGIVYRGSGDFVLGIKRLEKALDALRYAYEQHCSPAAQDTADMYRARVDFAKGKRALQLRVYEIRRMRDLESPPSADLGYVPGPEGPNLITLMRHMTLNGLSFAPSLPGNEAAYTEVWKKMFDLYVATDGELDFEKIEKRFDAIERR